MSEPHPSEDKAALYVLGELPAGERRDFETELAHSAELRSLVRELEESAMLLARSAPLHHPPSKVWRSIEKTIAADVKDKTPSVPFWRSFWRQGWAVAAVCVFGWLLYASWINRPLPADASKFTVTSAPSSTAESTHVISPLRNHLVSTPGSANDTNTRPATFQTDPREILRLRRQVTELESNVARLSQSVAQQHALLGESNRFKFFQLTSSSADAATAAPASLSPALQRAIFLAMASELGWLPSANSAVTDEPGNASTFPGQTNLPGVDFVDLRTSTNGAPNTPHLQSNRQPVADTSPEKQSTTITPGIAIPAFMSGNNLVVAIDQTIVPAGTQLNFLNGDQQPIGSTTLGDNPVVVTVPTSLSPGAFFISVGSTAGSSNIFQFYSPGNVTP